MTIHSLYRALTSSGIEKLIPLLLALLTVGGCARQRPEPPDAAAFALPQATPQNKNPNLNPPSSAGATPTNSDSLVPANWARIAGTWLSTALRRPETRLVRQTGVLAGKREAVSIDVVALATRHPAWQLADALERTQPVLLAFSPVNVPGAPGSPQTLPDAASLASPALPPLRAAPRATFSGFAASGYSPGFFRPELRVAATGFDALEWNARQRQDQALAAFIGDVAAAQNASLKTRRLSLEAGLEDDIEVAQRMGLAELEPSLLPDPMQLEMTNLRLRLLEQLYITEPERTAAEKRLQVLEAEWEEKLRRQETERLAELTRLRTAIPQRLRGEGVTHIALELDAVRRRYDAARQAVAEAQRTRIAQDFTMEENSLGIVLPSASLGPQQLEPQKLRTRASIAGGGRAGQHKNIRSGGSDGIIETVRADLASTGRFGLRPDLDLFADKSKPASSRAARIRALRALALSDARRWAQSAARRAGWEWIANSHTGSGRVSTPSGVAAPDRTQEALRLLNLS